MLKNRWDKKIVYILMISFTVLAFFGGYIHDTWQTDMYAQSFYPYSAFRNMFISNGRFMQLLYVKFWMHWGINPAGYPGIHVAFALLIQLGIIWVMWLSLQKYLKSVSPGRKLLVLIVLISMRVNVFQSDMIQYGFNVMAMYMGDLLAIIAALLLWRYPVWKIVPFLGMLLIVAAGFTQQCIFWFALWAVVLMFAEFWYCVEGDYKIFTAIMKSITVYFIACVFELFLFGYVLNIQGSRGDISQITISDTLKRIWDTGIWLLYDGMGIQPKFFNSILMGIYLSILCILTYNSGTEIKIKFKRLGIVLLLFAGIVLAIFAPSIVDTWMPHRSLSGFGTLVPFLVMALLLFLEVRKIACEKWILMLIIIGVSSNMLINWYWTTKIYQQQVLVNTTDQYDARFYYSKIEEYERTSGNVVSKIAWGFDQDPTYVLPGVIAPKSINDRAMVAAWSRRDIMPFVSGRRFDVVDFETSIYEEYFAGKDWDIISEEQIICIKDTAYIVCY